MAQFILQFKSVTLFLLQGLAALFRQKKINFPAISTARLTQEFPAIDPAILEAFKNNKLSSVQHCLLFEPAFEHKNINGMTIAYFKGERTDIYWGDFICKDAIKSEAIEKAIHAIIHDCETHSRFLAWVDIGEETAQMLTELKIPLNKFHLGDEWITDVKNFDVNTRKSRNFRKALKSAERSKLRIQEIENNESLDLINKMVAEFSDSKKLLFPRINAAVVKKYLYHPLISRRIWQVLDENNQIIAAVVACRIGTDTYYFEHAVHNRKYGFLLDWCLSQILLILKAEGVTHLSWGRMAHLFSDEEMRVNPNLWIIMQFYKLTGIANFTKNALQFKLDFVPIHKEPKWIFYNKFRPEVLMDITGIIGKKNFLTFKKINKV